MASKKPSYSTKKPETVSASVKSFVESGKVDASSKTTRRMRRGDDRAMARLTVWLTEDSVKAMKRHALENDTTVQDILSELVNAWASTH